MLSAEQSVGLLHLYKLHIYLYLSSALLSPAYVHLSPFLAGRACWFGACSLQSTMHSQKKVVGSRKTVKVGPWGGHGGSPWDDGSYSGVREITLVYDRCIDSIRILYDKNGKPVLSDKHGGSGGNLTVQVKLRYPEEFLTSVSGHYSPVVHGGSPVIRSLTFKSNQRTFGPFGVQEGTPFTFPMDGGMIVGFSGRGGWYLDAIGLCLSPIRTVGLYDTVQQKLQKFGNLATKTWGNRNGEHGSHATARTQKAHA